MLASLFLLFSCGGSNERSHHNEEEEEEVQNPNQALYNQVMDIHDEVMPKMDDLYKYKREFLERIANTPGMPPDQKLSLEKLISLLDSANQSMMNWMHNFNPPSDSVDRETTREYFETEMERIKKVRDLTNETLEKAKSASEKN